METYDLPMIEQSYCIKLDIYAIATYFSKTKGCKIPVDFCPKCDMIQLEMTNTAETEVTYSWNFRQY